MTEAKDLARQWLEGLAARGVVASISNNRLRLSPATALKTLTDDELITWRHHRAEIKELIASGVEVQIANVEVPPARGEGEAACTNSDDPAPTVPIPSPFCVYCNRQPCIGESHPMFFALHPIESQKREDDYAQKVMRRMINERTP